MTTPSIAMGGGSVAMNVNATGGGAIVQPPALPDISIERLRDVARLELAAQTYTQSCTFDGMPAVGLSVYQLPGTNALDVAVAVRKKMEELKEHFPEGVDYAIAYDTTPFIRDSVIDVDYLFEAVVLVGIVVLVFLQDWRAMIFPLIDVPVSIIGQFAVMGALGFSLNNISLFGLVLAIGIVVDDAIVVLENIERMMAKGHDARTAYIMAMDEVTGPVVAVGLVLLRCVRSLCIHKRNYRPFLSRVCGDNCRFDGHLGNQRRYHDPLASGSDFPGGRGQTGTRTSQGSIALVDLHLGRRCRNLLSFDAHVSSKGRLRLACLARSRQLKAINRVRCIGPSLRSTSPPGSIIGGILRWIIIHPLNAMLGLALPWFQLAFDAVTGVYAFLIGKGASAYVWWCWWSMLACW